MSVSTVCLSRFSFVQLTVSALQDQIVAASVEIEGELSEAEGYLRAMDIEFRSMTSMEKRGAQLKLNDYREELKQLQSTYTTSKLSAESIALKGGPSSRTKLLNANQKLDSSTATLEQSRQILANTQQVGDTVLTDLETQKETLMDARNKVKETKDFTSEARRVLRMMGNRAIIHKMCVIFTIIALGAAIVATGYYGVTKK